MRLHTILCHGRKSSMALVKATNARFGAYHVYRHYIVSKAHSIISPLVNHASMLTRLHSLYHEFVTRELFLLAIKLLMGDVHWSMNTNKHFTWN